MGRAAKACNTPGCPNQQPCPEHARKPWEGSTRRQRLPSNWSGLRATVLARDPICQDGRVCHGLALSSQVDHVTPGDDHDLANLQGICADCHQAKTQAEATAARRRVQRT